MIFKMSACSNSSRLLSWSKGTLVTDLEKDLMQSKLSFEAVTLSYHPGSQFSLPAPCLQLAAFWAWCPAPGSLEHQLSNNDRGLLTTAEPITLSVGS